VREEAVSDHASPSTINLAVVRGVASGPPEVRHLASGTRLASFALRTHSLGPPATSVPVAVWDPPAWAEQIDEGDELLVAGCVRRRFYRAASGALASRVELEASVVGRASDRRVTRRVHDLVAALTDALA
jgi:hypothetical protein